MLAEGEKTSFAEQVALGLPVVLEHTRGANLRVKLAMRTGVELTVAELLKRADAVTPGTFVGPLPLHVFRSIRIRLTEQGQYMVSTINTHSDAGKVREMERARLLFDAAGNLVGEVQRDWKD